MYYLGSVIHIEKKVLCQILGWVDCQPTLFEGIA